MDDLDALLDLEGAAFDDDFDHDGDDAAAREPSPPRSKRPLGESDADVGAGAAEAQDPSAKRPRPAAAGDEAPEEEEEDELVAMLATQVEVEAAAVEAAAVEAGGGGDDEGERREPSPPPPKPAPHPCRAAGDVDGEVAFPVTSPETGERVYLSFEPPRVRGSLDHLSSLSFASTPSSSSGQKRQLRRHLLSAPLSVLQDQAERDALDRALAAVEDRDLAEARRREDEDEASRRPSSSSLAPASRRPPAQKKLLWVDKYAPRSFMELLSDEQVNREVLAWVKSWDGVVFGNGRTNNANGGVGSSADGRPEHKILLLAGPPGLGKTTLAHVVARHCGYMPIEVNASDERSASSLAARVRDATEMRVVDSKAPSPVPRPACVIIDEIDGAVGGPEGRSAISALLRIVQATGGGGKKKRSAFGSAAAAAPSGRRDDDGSDSDDGDGGDAPARAPPSRSKKGSSGPGRLLRPIIAICNDAFAPALRPLRSAALVVHVRPPATARLVSRLKAVCAKENVRADRRALVAVAEASGRDVRSCLHGLQLLAGRSLAAAARARAARGGEGDDASEQQHRVITHQAASSLRSGAKDAKQSAFDVWGALLHSGAPKPRATSAASTSTSRSPSFRSNNGDVDRHRTATSVLWDAVSDFGDADLLLRGLHESLPRLRLADGRAARLAAATEALAAADAAATRGVAGSGSVDWALASYAPLGLLRFRAAVSGPDRPRVAWPALFADAERGRAANASALSTWSRSLPAALRAAGTAACSARAMVADVAPALLRVASAPGTRPVAHHLLSRSERASLDATVSTLASYNLGYSPRTSRDAMVLFSNRNRHDEGGGLGVGGPAAAFASSYAAAAESGAYGGSMATAAASSGGRQHSNALSSASSLSSAASLASAPSASLPGNAATPAPLREGDLDLFPTVVADVVTFGLGRHRPGASLPQPARALLASEVAKEVIRRREAAFADKGGGGGGRESAGKENDQNRRVSSAGTPVPLTLAERAAASGAAARAALAAEQQRQSQRKGTWLDQMRGRASRKRAGELAAAAVRAAASVAAAQERQMGGAVGGGNSGDSPGEAAMKASAAPKAVYRFNEGYTNAVRRPVRVREML